MRIFCCCCSVTQSCTTLCDLMDCSTPGFPVLHHLPELAQTHVHRVSDATQPSCPLSSPSPPACNPSQHQGLFESVLRIRGPKYWSFSFSFSINPSNEYSGLVSFRIDWFDFLTVQESFPAPLLKSISSSALSLLYITLISVHDHWKNHSFDYTDLCWQSNVSAF